MSAAPTSGPGGAGERGGRHTRIVRSFMTQTMADADILGLSTARERELARILGAIERSRRAAPGTLQHLVLYGNRGFGKSFMTRRVQIELARRWPEIPFLLLPEEQHSLQRDPQALLDTIALKLADSRSGGDSAYAAGHFRWPSTVEAERRWRNAEAALEQALDAALPSGGMAIVVVENFDLLLQRLFREDIDEQRLRRWLDRRGNRLMLFATATGTVDMDYDRPLFQAFESVRLEPWSSDDCIAYFGRLRAHQGQPPLSPSQEAKARAVAEFIGGTPRLAQLLGEVLDNEDALDVAEIMAALTDRLADYYRRRIEDLAPLSIGLLDALIRGGEPASQTELAARVGAGGQSDIARVMADLQQADIVRGLPAPDSREKLYRVPDRVFVHYYRLRQGSRSAQDTPLATILDFLRSFYTREEQSRQSLAHLEAGRLAEAGLFSRLAREGEAPKRNTYTRRFIQALRQYAEAVPGGVGQTIEVIASHLDGDRPETAYALCDVDTSGAVEALHVVIRAQALYRMGHVERARAVLENALEHAGIDAVAHFFFLEQLLFMAEGEKDAERLAEGFKDLAQKLPSVLERRRLRCLAWWCGVLGDHYESIENAKHAMALAALTGDEAEEAPSLHHLAYSLIELGRYDEAASVAARAAEYSSRTGDLLVEIISLRLRSCSLARLGEHQDAIRTASRAAVLAANYGDVGEEASSLRHLAYSLSQLGYHDDAVQTAGRAVALAAKAGDILEEAESLCHRAYSLVRLGRHEEAWRDGRRSVDLARKSTDKSRLAWSILECVRAAPKLSKPEVASLFGEWIRILTASRFSGIPRPHPWFGDLFIAVARADAWGELDKLFEEHADWLSSLEEPIRFNTADGAALARIGEERGRAAGYAAMAEALPRIARLIARLPEPARDGRWLVDLIEGYASACRDPGLLRDVASLLTPELAPQAQDSAQLLQKLAEADAAAAPEIALARMHPDIATWIRRLRNLPDPAPASPSRKGRRVRRG